MKYQLNKKALCELFGYISEIALAIRMNSAYSRFSQNNVFKDHDVMWLSDALHNFNMISDAIAIAETSDERPTSIEMLISTYKRYLESKDKDKGAVASFSRSGIDIQRGIEILESLFKVQGSLEKQSFRRDIYSRTIDDGNNDNTFDTDSLKTFVKSCRSEGFRLLDATGTNDKSD